MHWHEALEREKLRLILHSQSFSKPRMEKKDSGVRAVRIKSKIRKPRLPTPPPSPEPSQIINLKKLDTLGRQLEKRNSSVSKQDESDDSGKGDSEWSDASDYSTDHSV